MGHFQVIFEVVVELPSVVPGMGCADLIFFFVFLSIYYYFLTALLGIIQQK